MHRLRWILTIGWLLVIASLFYDPWTVALTQPDHPWSPLRLSETCVSVQGQCLAQQPYPLGATLFWGAIVPSGILILLVFGHELWRRICPLSFLSQIPRALGWQRQFKRENPATGKVRYELAKVKPDSWLGRNYAYLQFGWLFVGLCGRILFFNADRLVLGLWLVFTIAMAIAVGYFYGGKSWCQYFCPMAPVQTIFSEPGGLLSSQAQTSEQAITQSMCRTVSPDGEEKSACVACQSPCFDIDSERTYWAGLNQPEEAWIRYGYVGLVIGYFVYYYLYAGNWDYYFSGAWNRDPNQLAALMNPGLYVFGQPINIPKLFAVPLVLGGFTAAGYAVGRWIERRAKSQHRARLSADIVQHRIFAICTFFAFNFFFFFAGRPLLLLLPLWVQYGFDVGLVFLSTLWLQKSWRRNPDLYSREKLASRFRKQLEKLQLAPQLLEGRTLSDLHADELYVLAKVLPNFTREKRHEAYKGVVRESLEEGYVNYSSSLALLQQMRQELGVSDAEHREVLEELGIENPDLLNPNRQRSLENQIRLSGYQKSLERVMRLRQSQPDLLPQDAAAISSLRREYSITSAEEDWILQEFSSQASGDQKADLLLARLADWSDCGYALDRLPDCLPDWLPDRHTPANRAVATLLQTSVSRKQTLIVQTVLEMLADPPADLNVQATVQALQRLAPQKTAKLLQTEKALAARLGQASPELRRQLQSSADAAAPEGAPEGTLETSSTAQSALLSHLEALLEHYDPLVEAAALYLIAQLNADRAIAIAQTLCQSPSSVPSLSPSSPPSSSSSLLQETAAQLLTLPPAPPLKAFPTLEKLVYLFNSDFFQAVQTETLMALAAHSSVETYAADQTITEPGDTCRELLLLIDGQAKIHYQLADGIRVEHLQVGQMLDELEVLTQSDAENTIIAETAVTRILAVSVEALDQLLDQDPAFTRRVLELESRQLQRLMRL